MKLTALIRIEGVMCMRYLQVVGNHVEFSITRYRDVVLVLTSLTESKIPASSKAYFEFSITRYEHAALLPPRPKAYFRLLVISMFFFLVFEWDAWANFAAHFLRWNHIKGRAHAWEVN
jgi:hypothetical protein